MFKVQCTSCRETHSNYVGVNRFVGTHLPEASIYTDNPGLGDQRYEWKPRRGQLRLEMQELQGKCRDFKVSEFG